MLLWVIGIFIALDLLIVGLFFVPSVQNYVIGKVTGLISEKWGADIGVSRIYVTPTLRIAADDFVIKDLRDNPMIYVKHVKGRFKTLKTSPLTLSFHNITAEEADVALVIYEGDTTVNISAWVKKISKPKKTHKDFILRSDNIKLVNSRFSVANQNRQQKTPYIDGQELDPGFFEMRHIDFKANRFQVYNDDISALIKQFSYDQYFGFRLLDGSGDFEINGHMLRFDDCKLLTENSNLDLDLRFDYNQWKNLGDFLDSVNITATVRPSDFCLTDAACYAAAIRGMDNCMHFQGLVSGCVNDLKLIDFDCHYNNSTYFKGDFALKDVTDFKHAVWNLNFNDSYFNMKELAEFKLPNGKTIPLPDIAKRLGYAKLRGTLAGYVPAIDAKLNVSTGIGDVKTNISSKDIGEQITFEGNLSSGNFNLGQLINNRHDFGQLHFHADIEGISDDPMDKPEFLSTLKAKLRSKISRFDLLGYPASGISLNGQYDNKKCTASVFSTDQNMDLIFNGLADFSLLEPNFQANLSLKSVKLSEMASHHAPIDTAEAKGFDKLILFAQQHPNVEIMLDTLSMNIVGTKLETLNGYAGIDGLQIYNEKHPFVSNRIRFTAINTAAGLHKYIFSSDILNATLNTNYAYKDIKDSLLNVAYRYIPNLLPQRDDKPQRSPVQSDMANKHFNFSFETFDTEPLLYIFMPELYVADHSSIDLRLNDVALQDKININIPQTTYKDRFNISNLQLNANSSKNKHLMVYISGDSITLANQKGAMLSVYQLGLKADVFQSLIDFQLSWKDQADIHRQHSHINGIFDARDKTNMVGKITDSQLFLNEYVFRFNNHNAITIQKNRIIVDNLVFSDDKSSILLDGAYSKLPEDHLLVNVNNFDISLVNNFLKGIYFDGELSANADISMRNNNRFIMGKLLASDFGFNRTKWGNVFLTAGIGESGSLGFSGGIFRREQAISSSIINEYTIKNYQTEQDKLANINGYYLSRIKRFVAKASIGSIDLGFLGPFLSSFSDNISGNASGELSFIASPDSSFISGKAHVNRMTMGITSLGTLYNIENQEVSFNNQGIVFDNIILKDKDNNTATMNGHIYHKLFKDMKIDLSISTHRIMAMNLPRNSSASFYGNGYVSGEVRIFGDDKRLSFSSGNLTTLKGSSIVFPITSSQSVSESNNIRFKTVIQDSVVVASSDEGKMKLDFDFMFNVTPETDVQVDVFSIGGTMRGNTSGPLHLLYNDDDGLNIYGNLEIMSGDFLLSLENIINTKLKLVPGGQVIFNGPVADFVVHTSAYYTARTSLSNILGTEEALGATRTPVNAYIHLDGQLMKYPSLDFSFELPNVSQEVSKGVFMVIDTTNPQNRSKQFFIFLLTNQFMPEDASSADITSTMENGGIGILTNMVNNFLSKQMKHAGVGIVYKSANQQAAAEYGLNANVQFLNDRMIFETNIGYYDNNTYNGGKTGIKNFYGDFSLEYLITQRGNWRVKIYNFNDQYAIESYKKIPGVGLALLYKQEFNNRKDFSEDFLQQAKITIDKKERKNKKKQKKDEK
ncbi:MAG: translocation/assembly module TamB domain-containing protein [Bacteroidales bacterium]|nr:translocation/assembly module TamB domain-containing protein [Bacteroidales bacterium]